MAKRVKKRRLIPGKNFEREKTKVIECRQSGCYNSGIVPVSVNSYLCWRCVQLKVDPPKGYLPYNKKTGKFLDPETRKPIYEDGRNQVKKPRGWAFMSEFVDTEGNVYHKGIEQPKLKGTLEPTKIADVKKTEKKIKSKVVTEHNKNKMLIELQLLKKKLKAESRKSYIAKYTRQIKRIEKDLL